MGAAAARRLRRSPFVWGLLARRGSRSFPSQLLGFSGTVSSDPLAEPPRKPLARALPETPRRPSQPAVHPVGGQAAARWVGLGIEGSRLAGPAGGRRAGPRPRRAHTHPLLAAGGRAGGRGRVPGDWDRGDPPGARGAGVAGGPAGGEGQRGRRPRGGGTQLCPLALGGGGAVCTPLRRSCSSADGWDLKFFLPLWKSGRMGGVAMTTAPFPPSSPPSFSPRGRPDDSGLLVLSCDGPFPAHTRTSPSPPPIPVLLQFRLPFWWGRNRFATNFWAWGCHSAGCSGWQEIVGTPHRAAVAFFV